MADILLSFGVSQTDGDVKDIRKGLESIITKIEQNPPKVRVGLTVDNDALRHFKKELEAILNTVSLANGAPITLNISGLGEISAQATEATNAMKRATGATKQHGSALTQVLNSYREMHALMRKNQNATDATTESYKGVRAQADFFKDALELARRESVSIEVAFARMGVSIDTALKNATDSMAKLKAEMEHTGQSGTVTAKQVYDTVAKMREAVSKNKNASGLDSYQLVSGQLGNWEAAAELIRKGGATVEQALSLIGDRSESASAKVASITTAIASMNEEMKRTGASGTTTKTQIENILTQARTLISGNENARGLTSFEELNRLLIKISPVLATVKADGSDLFDKLSSSGIDAKTVVQELQAAMSKFKNEMSSTGQSGTVTAKQLYDTVAKMREAVNKNKNASGLDSYQVISSQLGDWESAADLVRQGSATVEQALSQIGGSSDSASAKVVAMSTALSSLNEEMEHTGTSGTVTTRQLYDLTAQMKTILNANANASSTPAYENLKNQLASLDAVLDAVAKDGISVEQAFQRVYGAGVNVAQTFDGAKTSMSAFRQSVAGTEDDTEKFQKQMRQLDTIIKQVETSLKNWTKAKGGKTSDYYKALEKECDALKEMRSDLASTGKALDKFNSKVGKHAAAIQKSSAEIKNAGEDTKSLADKVGGLAEKFSTWLGVSQAVMAAVRTIKKMVATVVELDTAMTELKKVTNETDATYERFLNKASDRAKSLGVSMSDVVKATSEFARLGYNVSDASKLADIALMYKNIGDGIEDVTQASESIVSTMQAFGILPNQAEHIVDVFNSIGNSFAVSSGGLGDALQRSAAAMNAAGNTLEETAALVAAANTVVQNTDSVGTTLKTVSMFLRASKVEAEEAGESTEGMANSVSELREQLLALTNGQVDILTDAGQYKSTYEILRDIASVWDNIVNNQGTDSAAILELIGGKSLPQCTVMCI